ncbi:MAG: nucleotidyltransferase family protein [Gemmatimonadaceae bacterium]
MERLRAPENSVDADQSWLSAIPDETWRTFIILERCASPLLAAVMDKDDKNTVPITVLGILRQEAARETESVLMAERDARWIASCARTVGAKPIALKGLLPVLAGTTPPLHLLDVDILASAEDARLLSPSLASAGFTAATDNEIHHVYWHPPSGHLPIEIHETIFADGSPVPDAMARRVTEVSGTSGLYRLAYADQMVHVLVHSLVQHKERHIRIRDLLLMSWFLDRMTDDDRLDLDSQINALDEADKFRALLGFAMTFGNAQGSSESRQADPFEDEAILIFAATLLASDSALWKGGPSFAWHGAASVAAGRTSIAALTRFAGRNPVTGIETFATLQKKTPTAGRVVTRFGRAVLYFTSATFGSPLLLNICREVKRRLIVPFPSR